MAENEKIKKVKTRLQLKHDTKANWQNATGFKPWPGELVIYDEENPYSPAKLKVGDGSTPVNDLNFINVADTVRSGDLQVDESTPQAFHTYEFKSVPVHSLMNLCLTIDSPEQSLCTWTTQGESSDMTTAGNATGPEAWTDYGIVEISNIAEGTNVYGNYSWREEGNNTFFVKRVITGNTDSTPTTSVCFNLTKTLQESALGLPCLIGKSNTEKKIYIIYIDFLYIAGAYTTAQIKCAAKNKVLSYSLHLPGAGLAEHYNFSQIPVPSDFYFESFGLLNCSATAIADTYIKSTNWCDNIIYSEGATVILRNTTELSSASQKITKPGVYYLSLPHSTRDTFDLSVEMHADLVPFSYELRVPYEETLKILNYATPLIEKATRLAYLQAIGWGTADPTDLTSGQIYFKYK